MYDVGCTMYDIRTKFVTLRSRCRAGIKLPTAYQVRNMKYEVRDATEHLDQVRSTRGHRTFTHSRNKHPYFQLRTPYLPHRTSYIPHTKYVNYKASPQPQ
jgi:hypothetical protein